MKKILIIDDDPVVATVYQQMLEREGFATEVAVNGAQGLYRALSFEPDAVLLDLLMPTLNGFIVMKTMHTAFCGLPVIVVTSACTPEFQEKALAAGASYVLDKSKATASEIISLLHLAMDGVPSNRMAAFEQNEIGSRLSDEPSLPGSR